MEVIHLPYQATGEQPPAQLQGPLLLDDPLCVTSVEPSVGMNLLLFCRIFWILCLHVGPGHVQSQPWGLGTAHCSETPRVQVELPASTPGSFLPFPVHHLTADSSDLLILPLVLAVRQKQGQDERTTWRATSWRLCSDIWEGSMVAKSALALAELPGVCTSYCQLLSSSATFL